MKSNVDSWLVECNNGQLSETNLEFPAWTGAIKLCAHPPHPSPVLSNHVQPPFLAPPSSPIQQVRQDAT